MNVSVEPGNYVVAVSGGVDSVVLLNMLMKNSLNMTVAHFDHGIRADSAQDALFVTDLAKQYNLPFVTARAELGAGASEAVARDARYAFLRDIQKRVGAQAIITAHHQDDVLETAMLNVLRGTGRRGLTALASTPDILRPLLDTPKTDILAYAAKQKLSWREDSTNHDERYTRNYIRHRLLVKLEPGTRQQLLAVLARLQRINTELDGVLATLLTAQTPLVKRSWFNALPHDIAKEFMAAWLRSGGLADFDRRTIERLTVQAKTKPAGRSLDVLHKYRLQLSRDHLALELVER